PLKVCYRPTSMWCVSCQSWPLHRNECILGTHTQNFATPPVSSVVLFSPEGEHPNIITVECRPSKILSQGMRPQPLVSGHFPDAQAESIILTQDFNGEPLRFPLHLWYLPTALLTYAPIHINPIAIHPTGTSVVSAFEEDTHVRF
ncbi:uncharacterized protein EDB93DRAFT_1085209, partial [Suillus bovinus]|uniref:uncharacterized protein n=1 Tax=Suillus bovinus TaxID=48563 RepID=UPI001B8771C6